MGGGGLDSRAESFWCGTGRQSRLCFLVGGKDGVSSRQLVSAYSFPHLVYRIFGKFVSPPSPSNEEQGTCIPSYIHTHE